MLEAKNRVTGEIVKAWKMTSAEGVALKNEIAKMETKNLLTCFDPDCGCDRYIKAIDSQFVTMHFARYPGTGNYNCGGAGESIEHMLAKSKLALWLQERSPLSEITTEMVIKTPGGYKEMRRIDVAETLPDGTIYAHEIQRSRQDVAVTQQRTADYMRVGIGSVVWWWIGEHYYSVEWCVKELDYYGTMKPVYKGEKLHDFLIAKTVCAEVLEQRRIARERRRLALDSSNEWDTRRLPKVIISDGEKKASKLWWKKTIAENKKRHMEYMQQKTAKP